MYLEIIKISISNVQNMFKWYNLNTINKIYSSTILHIQTKKN